MVAFFVESRFLKCFIKLLGDISNRFLCQQLYKISAGKNYVRFQVKPISLLESVAANGWVVTVVSIGEIV